MWEPTRYSFFCLPFVFLCFSFFFFFCSFLCLPLIIARSLLLSCGDACSPFAGFLLLRLALAAKEGNKTGVIDFLVVELCWTGFVCSLCGVWPSCIQGQVSVPSRFGWFTGRFRCLFFQCIY